MNPQTPELQELLVALNQKKPMVAMLAPSFPIMFSFPQIVGKLKRLGFNYIVEVATGARIVNKQLLELLSKNPQGRYITSPCPAIVRLIRQKYPNLNPFLAPIDSPMSATAKMVLEKYPETRPVFIGPCFVKKLEAKEDRKELNILVLTFSELLSLFDYYGVSDTQSDNEAKLDIAEKETRLYPVSGGLAQSSSLNNLLTDEEYDVVSGYQLVKKSLEEFPNNRVRVLDILFCEGGCIAGAGISSSLLLEERRAKIVEYWHKKT